MSLATSIATPYADTETWSRRAGAALHRLLPLGSSPVAGRRPGMPLSNGHARVLRPRALRKWPFLVQPALQPAAPAPARQPAVPVPRAPAVPVSSANPAGGVAGKAGNAAGAMSHIGDARHMTLAAQEVSLRRMVIDVAMVASWAIAIPALMWLGAMGGF